MPRTFPDGLSPWILDGFNQPGILIVSGSGPNRFGHALLRLSTWTGYCHVHELHNYPEFVSPTEIGRYLSDNNKRLLGEINVKVPNIDAARAELDRLMKLQWRWLAIRDNCVDFCTTVLNAGGAGLPGHLSNLPSHALKAVLERSVGNAPEIHVGPQTTAAWLDDSGL